MHNSYVIKRQNHESQRFDPLKLHRSIVAACLAVRAFEGEAHLTAEHVCQQVIDWLITKPEVTTDDIRRVSSNALANYHPEAAYMYQHHRLIA